MTQVWRLRMKSAKAGVDHDKARAFAFKHGWVGAGWGLDCSDYKNCLRDGSTDFAAYYALATEAFPNDKSLSRASRSIAEGMVEGDYCWVYNTSTGEYWCARIKGAFQYRQGAVFDRYDLHIVRPCDWINAGTAEAVPGSLRRAFAGQFGTVTRLLSDQRRLISSARTAFGELEEGVSNDLYEAAGPDDLEDLVALFLQHKGWLVYPSTATKSMASYEFVLCHRKTGERAGVQVKSGGIRTLDQKVAADFKRFFVLLGGKDPVVTGDPRITVIDRDEILEFAKKNRSLLPKRLTNSWV